MTTEAGAGRSILSSSAVMAAGTVVSRLSGFVRSALLAAALGLQLHADIFNIANTIPNMLYILLAGGAFNAVLVPQLVRAMRNDNDGGAAYANRIVTLAALFLAGVSAVLVIAAPVLMKLFLSSAYDAPALAAQRDSVIAFARFCLPQVFFYGMFVLVGQILNARGSFGPMMWAPIANNVVSVAVLTAYLAVFGKAVDVCANPNAHPAAYNSVLGPFSNGQELLLGLGSTLGIAVQFLVLLPYLRRAGFSYAPRFDFRGTGLGHTLRLGIWTVLFVIVNQIAYTIVVRIASGGTAAAVGSCDHTGATGYTIYSNAFLLVMVPQGIITVSLATAMLPRLSSLAAEGDLAGLARGATGTMRTAFSLILPFCAVLPIIALDIANVVYGYGASRDTYDLFGPTLSLFGLGLFFFTAHYLMLRAFYALEQTRRVFFIQCAVSGTNIVMAWLLTRSITPAQTAPRLVIAYAAAYAVGAAVSAWALSRQVGGLDLRRQVRFLVRMGIVTVIATAAVWLVVHGAHRVLQPLFGDTNKLVAVVALALGGIAELAVLVFGARMFRIEELSELFAVVGRRGRRGGSPTPAPSVTKPPLRGGRPPFGG